MFGIKEYVIHTCILETTFYYVSPFPVLQLKNKILHF